MRAPQHEQHTDAQRLVAANVRAELSRERWSGRKAADAIGWTQPYLSRRLSGDLPFDVNDLAAISGLLDVPITRFLTGVKKAPAVSRTARASQLPDLDSNQEPAVSWPAQGDRQYRIRRRRAGTGQLNTRGRPIDPAQHARNRVTRTHPANRVVPRHRFSTADFYATT